MSSIVKVDTIQENTSANGITVDGLNIKDSKLVTADSVVTNNITANAVTAAKLNADIISGTTELASEPADTDEFLVSDAGTLKRIDYSLIKGGGITEADLWRLSADTSAGGYITSNWERADTDGQNHLGTGMSESSGVFTFPSTGYYLIMAMGNLKFTGGAHDQADFTIYSTENNADYARAAIANGSSATSNYHESTATTFLFDVTDTSNHKLKFYSNGNWTLRGNTSQNQTHVTFIRLGDT